MKLNHEQCSQLPFPIGCRVWYNIRTDELPSSGGGGAVTNTSTSTAVRSVDHGDGTEHRSAPVDAESSDIGQTSIRGPLTFEHGVVSAAYLDVMVSNILYEVKPDGGVDTETTLGEFSGPVQYDFR